MCVLELSNEYGPKSVAILRRTMPLYCKFSPKLFWPSGSWCELGPKRKKINTPAACKFSIFPSWLLPGTELSVPHPRQKIMSVQGRTQVSCLLSDLYSSETRAWPCPNLSSSPWQPLLHSHLIKGSTSNPNPHKDIWLKSHREPVSFWQTIRLTRLTVDLVLLTSTCPSLQCCTSPVHIYL